MPYKGWMREGEGPTVWARNPSTAPPKNRSGHVIVDIIFARGEYAGAAPVECSCGLRTYVDYWKAHKADPSRADLPDPGPLRGLAAPRRRTRVVPKPPEIARD